MNELSHVGMSTCFFCGEVKEIVLDRRLRNTLPRQACYNHEPCDKCKKLMEQGVMFISVRDGEGSENPYRTGKLCVVKDEAVRRWPLDEPLKADILRKRVCFIEDSVWQRIGLPA